ncbi:MAG: GNAT family N-acetyltransferase [Lachnospiraceae bacterium]|nr:GNAT family N-acetyltransferase [Lachnospiraceae bacterium]
MSAENLYLRPITPQDTDRIVAWRNRDFVRKNFIYQKPFTREGHEVWLKEQVEPGHVAQFIICVPAAKDRLRKTESIYREIGSVYLRDIDREAGEAEYGIFIGESDALGRGYGTQAAKLMLDYGFGTLGLKKIFLRFLEDNAKALRSYEKAGFQMINSRRETVSLEQGVREVLFMEIDYDTWKSKIEENLSI